jgi:hypothetical protein
MARIRNLRPSFFKDEHLAELPPLTRLLFEGLWTLADKAGNLEDRPRFIKVEVLPYDECDIDEMLAALVAGGFIRRYEADEHAYIHIPRFTEHQRVSGDEAKAPTVIPPPDEPGKKQRRSRSEAGPKHARDRSTEIGVLSTENGVLTTDTAPVARLVSSSSSAQGMGSTHIAAQELVALWNQHRRASVVFADLQPESKRILRTALTAKSLDAWEAIFQRIEPSDYLAGRLEFPAVGLFKAIELADRIAEGQYENRAPARRGHRPYGVGVAAPSSSVAVVDPDYNGAPYRFHCAHTPPCTTWPQHRDAEAVAS